MLLKFRLQLILITIRHKFRLVIHRLGISDFHRALSLRQCLFTKLQYQLILLTKPSPSEQRNAYYEQVIKLAAFRLMYPEYFDSNLRETFLADVRPAVALESDVQRIQNEYEDHRAAVDNIVTCHSNAEHIKPILAQAFQVQSYLDDYFKNDQSSVIHMDIARNYDPSISKLLSSNVSARLRSVRKELKNLEEAASSRQAIKISFSSEQVLTMISVSSGLFLISGYLYTHSLLGNFGIDVSHFFVLTDYVAASVKELHHSLLATIIASLVGFMVIHSRSRLSHSQAMRTAAIDTRVYTSILLLSCLMTLYTYFEQNKSFYFFCGMTLMMLSSKPVVWMVRRHIVEKYWLISYTILQLMFLFFLSLYSSVKREIYKIENSDIEQLKHYDISVNSSLDISIENTVLIASNSRYIFVRNSSNGQVYIVPTDQIKSISILPRQNSVED